MLRLAAGASRCDGGTVEFHAAKRVGQKTERDRDVALKRVLGAGDLIDQRVLDRAASDGDDLRILRRIAGWIPGRLILDQQREIHLLQIGGRIETEIKVMRLREVRNACAGRIEHRDREKLGERNERFERLRVRASILHQDERRPRLGEQRRDMGDVGGSRLGSGRRRNGTRRLGLRPFLDHRIHRHAKVCRSLRDALRKLAGAYDAVVERRNGRRLKRRLDDRFDQALRSADHVQVAIPLRSGVEFALAIAKRFPGHHEHGRFHGARAVDRHAALQQARTRMQQHGLHAAGDLRVAGGHGDRERLVTAIQIGRAGCAAFLLARESLPERRPLRARRRNDILDIQAAERFEYGFAAILDVFQVGTPNCQESITRFVARRIELTGRFRRKMFASRSGRRLCRLDRAFGRRREA